MAVDPRLERLPEHEGPAFRTWQLIMQTTMGSVITQAPSGFHFSNDLQQKSISPGDEFIALNQDDSEDDVKARSSRKDCNEALIPWKSVDQYPSNALGLHKEITDFYKYMSPLPEEESMRQNVVDRISALIVSVWPSAKVEVFGSFRTKLYLPTSDIDLAVFGKWEHLPLFTLEKELIENDIADASTIKVLDKASVPIIKLTDKLSKIRVDISFNVETSVQSAEMIKSFMNEYKILPSLFLILKHFLVQRDLNEVFTGGISSYCLMLLTISFLQRHPRIDVRKSKVNLGVVLMEFFELYGRNFNYQRIAVIIRGSGEYRSKETLAKQLGDGVFLPLLCIEDPVTGSCDIGKSSYGILRVKEAFEYAFNVLDIALRKKYYFKVNRNSTYLSRIISVPKQLLEYRQWVQASYKPKTFVPKSKPVSPPILYPAHDTTQFTTGNNHRPALLPTPPSPYSPRMPVVTPPFSPFSPSNTSLRYNQMAFFDADPHLLMPNMRNEKETSQHTATRPLKSPVAFNGKRFVNPSRPYGLNQDSFTSSNQPLIQSTQPILQNPVKTLVTAPSSNMFASSTVRHQISSIFSTFNQQNQRRTNNNIHSKPPQNQSRNNSTTRPQRTSPMLSPKVNAKFSGRETKATKEKSKYDEPRNYVSIDNRQCSDTSVDSSQSAIECTQLQEGEVIVISDDEN